MKSSKTKLVQKGRPSTSVTSGALLTGDTGPVFFVRSLYRASKLPEWCLNCGLKLPASNIIEYYCKKCVAKLFHGLRIWQPEKGDRHKDHLDISKCLVSARRNIEYWPKDSERYQVPEVSIAIPLVNNSIAFYILAEENAQSGRVMEPCERSPKTSKPNIPQDTIAAEEIQEVWLAHLQRKRDNNFPLTVMKYIREWRLTDKCISWSGRTYSPNWYPISPREDGRVGYIVRSKGGHVVDRGDLRREYDRRSLEMWESNDQYEIEYEFDDGWPGTTGGMYRYRRPHTSNTKNCTNTNCDILSQDMQGKPDYYMVGDICWECCLSKGIDPVRLVVDWLWLVDAAFTEGLLTRKQAIAFYLDMADYYSKFQGQVAHKLGITQQSLQERLARTKKNLGKAAKSPVLPLHSNRGRMNRIAARIRGNLWHQPPRWKPTETLLTEWAENVLAGNEEPLKQLEAKCKPAGWKSSTFGQNDVELYDYKETGDGDAFQTDDDRRHFHTTGSGRVGSCNLPTEMCPECLRIIVCKSKENLIGIDNSVTSNWWLNNKCPFCKTKLKLCDNKACGNMRGGEPLRPLGKQLLLATDAHCTRCGTLQPI